MKRSAAAWGKLTDGSFQIVVNESFKVDLKKEMMIFTVSHLLQQTVKDLSVNWEFNWYFCLCQGRRVSSHRRRVSSLLYLQDELIVTLSLFFLRLPLARRSLIRSPRFEDGGGGRSISTPMHMVIVVIDAEQLLEGWCFGKLLLN